MNPILTASRNLSIIGFALCLLVGAVYTTVGFDVETPWMAIIFVGMFPLFAWTCKIIEERKEKRFVFDWVPLLFRNLDSRFILIYKSYFFGVWLLCFYLMTQGYGNIGFFLIPSVFYLTSFFGLWSEIEKRKNENQSHWAMSLTRHRSCSTLGR